MPEDKSDRMLQYMPDTMPIFMPDRTSEYLAIMCIYIYIYISNKMPARMTEYMSVRL